MEFKLITPEQSLSALMIEFNNEELKQEISEKVKKYENIVYTDNNIGEAKEDRAGLRKFVKAEDRRIAVKKEYLKPYDSFEAKVKELVALVEKPILLIDTQIDDYEERKRDQKRTEIEAIYQNKIGNLKDLIPLSLIWNDKWLNATHRLPDIEKEIEGTAERIRDDLNVILDLGSEFEPLIKDSYLRSLDLAKALGEKRRLEEQKKALSAFARSSQGYSEPATYLVTEDTGEEPKLITFSVWVTTAQKRMIGEFLVANGIEIEKEK
jgi:hypothetical protein